MNAIGDAPEGMGFDIVVYSITCSQLLTGEVAPQKWLMWLKWQDVLKTGN